MWLDGRQRICRAAGQQRTLGPQPPGRNGEAESQRYGYPDQRQSQHPHHSNWMVVALV
jgi:hypothetical protein